MLRCEISVPALSKSYEFCLNEHVKVPDVVGEIVSVIKSYEHCTWADDAQGVVLCDTQLGSVLPNEKTLYECHVSPGSKLMLV